MAQPAATGPQYRTFGAVELKLDRYINWIGALTGIVGAIVLAAIAAGSASLTTLLSVVAYGVGLIAMLVCSAAYNEGRGSRRHEILRRLDHAAIFVMIAGSYTPFTVNRLPFAWAVGMTSLIWAVALAGATLKLAYPRSLERISVVPYLALGWVGLIAMGPLWSVLDGETLSLLGAGAALYTLGSFVHLWHRLPFQNAAWHGFVMAAAACHYVAVFHVVVTQAA